MPYSKPWLSLSDQLDQLKRRGMLIEDESKARTYLERIGYYRLSGYWFAFRERSETCCAWPPHTTGGKPKKQDKGMRLPLDEFKAGATFQNAVQLYVFDKKLREGLHKPRATALPQGLSGWDDGGHEAIESGPGPIEQADAATSFLAGDGARRAVV